MRVPKRLINTNSNILKRSLTDFKINGSDDSRIELTKYSFPVNYPNDIEIYKLKIIELGLQQEIYHMIVFQLEKISYVGLKIKMPLQ